MKRLVMFQECIPRHGDLAGHGWQPTMREFTAAF